ncbi:MAG: hypothetical protein HLUCCA12_08260 [Rhodobacteraceae bacterium HLUCCA12]|nr:MAG: hypothetical protein HLUCCA12_08260 [Rhodobacteraceae bacterium HLUCCA12]
MRTSGLSVAAGVLIALAGPALTDTPILTVTGQVADAPVELTERDLKALPQHRLATSTTVTDGTPVFEGFLMRDLLAQVGAEGEAVVALALNDYRIEIPLTDFQDFDVIGAMTMDGEPLSPRDKGPVWIVYPRDDHSELQDIRYDTRWVWQLVSLHVQ